jgi:hypothetical protein
MNIRAAYNLSSACRKSWTINSAAVGVARELGNVASKLQAALRPCVGSASESCVGSQECEILRE